MCIMNHISSQISFDVTNIQFFSSGFLEHAEVQILGKILERVCANTHFRYEPFILNFMFCSQKFCHLDQTFLVKFVVMTLLFAVVLGKYWQQIWLIFSIFLIFQWSSHSASYLAEISFKVLKICFNQFCDTWKSRRFQICSPNVLGNFLV
jgi:hypothetical protein